MDILAFLQRQLRTRYCTYACLVSSITLDILISRRLQPILFVNIPAYRSAMQKFDYHEASVL